MSLPKREGRTGGGFDVPFWFVDSAQPSKPKSPDEELIDLISDNSTVNARVFLNLIHSKGYRFSCPDQVINDLIIKNPTINANTLINVIKAKGYSIAKVKEADAASANAASTRAGVDLAAINPLLRKKMKAKKIKQSKNPNEMNLKEAISCTLIETDGTPNKVKINGPQKFKVILLQEGLGNLRDAYYYTKAALKSAVPVFEGKKIYSDHPSADEETVRPERSVRDVLGHFENIRFEEDKEGRGSLVGDVRILPDHSFDWARGLMCHAVEYSKKYPDKEFIGLSINANGDAGETSLQEFLSSPDLPESVKPKLMTALEQGIETIRLVHVISEATSCDLVTEPGAGGKVLELLEGDKKMNKEILEEKDKNPLPQAESEKEDEAKKEGDKDQKEADDLSVPVKEDEAKKEEESEDGQDGEDHDDEDQDKKLIKSMLDKHLGKPEHDEEETKLAHEAYQAARAGGEDESEAMKCAGYAMRMARHMAAFKKNQTQADDMSVPVKQAEAKKEDESDKKKESDKVLTLAAENAKLKKLIETREIQDYLEQKLTESKLPRSATKLFKETVGEFKSKKQIDEKLEKFTKHYTESQGGEADDVYGFVTMQEKSEKPSGSESFADCVTE